MEPEPDSGGGIPGLETPASVPHSFVQEELLNLVGLEHRGQGVKRREKDNVGKAQSR